MAESRKEGSGGAKMVIPDIYKRIESVSPPRNLPRPTCLLSYLSVEEKVALATTTRQSDIRPYLLRYFESIKERISIAVENTPADVYLEKIVNAWRRVEKVNGEIDSFIYRQEMNPISEWSLKELRMARELLAEALDAEDEKNLYSGGLKRKLDLETKRLKEKFNLNDEEVRLLTTLGEGTFYERYRIDHAQYFLSSDEEKKKVLRDALLQQYHGNDSRLFDARMREFCFEKLPRESLEEEILSFNANMKERSVAKGYLMMERPEIKTFEALLRFDNWDEYLSIYTFKAFPEAVLRQRLLAAVKKAEIAPDSAHFLQYSHAEFLELVDQLIKQREETFHIPLETYLQTDNTCGTACVMMIIEKMGVPMNPINEKIMWARSGKPFNFPGGMARELIENGFNVDYIQYPDIVFTPDHIDLKNRDPFMIEKAQEYIQLHDIAVEMGMGVAIEDWNFDTVVTALKNGQLPIIGVDIGSYGSEVLHWVIAQGYRQKGNDYVIEIIDPLVGRYFISREELESKTVTSMGKRLLLAHRD